VGALWRGVGDFSRRHEAAAEEALFIFAIEEDDPHDQVLDLADEELDLGLSAPFGWGEPLPVLAVLAEAGEGFMEPRQEEAFDLVKVAEGGRLGLTQGLRFALGEGEQLAADDVVGAQILEQLRQGVHCFFSGGLGLVAEGGGGLR
jgi:hypothetical protein